jgi:hypothetical protein
MPSPTPEFLAECARRVLEITRGVPRRHFDSLAAECGIVIGTLCETTEAAAELTERLIANPLAKWDFASFRDRARKLRESKPADVWDAIRRDYEAEQAATMATIERGYREFHAQPASQQAKQLNAKLKHLRATLAPNDDVLKLSPARLREHAEFLVILDILHPEPKRPGRIAGGLADVAGHS